jgi:glycine/D-amino acid oxidase-like deaminating enzyme
LKTAVVIGGGFYGTAIALYLKEKRGFSSVTVLEQESELLQRASYHNQARVHNGYHYPRSFTTAFRSRINLPRFVEEYGFAIKKDFTKLYAIARRNSKVTAKQFVRFCHEIGANIESAPNEFRDLFDSRLIEDVFLVEEFAFDSKKLAQYFQQQLAANEIGLQLNSVVTAINKDGEGLRLLYQKKEGLPQAIHADFVFNCTYSGLNHLGGEFRNLKTGMKHEITEMGLVKVPSILENVGVTVMDGPFFSMMPFPARRLHTVSHVRYTPHLSWIDDSSINPYQKLLAYQRESRVDRMLRDIRRYMPGAEGCEHVDSLFEVKTILMKNEGDDGRPILFEKSLDLPGLYSILGGKIDNIYDVLEKLDSETLVNN